MKMCELCGVVRAGMYCQSDRASLCWDCDEKVHSANFLVAKHSRVLLCHVCQLQTPWASCGVRLTPTVSVCQSCVRSRNGKIEPIMNEESKIENEEENENYDEEEHEDEDEDEDEGDEDDDENQVVPWSCCSVSPEKTSPPTASGSNSDEAEVSVSSKRLRENVDADCSDDDDEVVFDGTASFGGSLLRPLKRPSSVMMTVNPSSGERRRRRF